MSAPTLASGPACPVPLADADRVQLGHGSGGKMSAALLRDRFLVHCLRITLRPFTIDSSKCYPIVIHTRSIAQSIEGIYMLQIVLYRTTQAICGLVYRNNACQPLHCKSRNGRHST